MIVAACITVVALAAAAAGVVLARRPRDEFAREVTASTRARSGLARAVKPEARRGHPPGSP